jgi:hypothetical protein
VLKLNQTPEIHDSQPKEIHQSYELEPQNGIIQTRSFNTRDRLPTGPKNIEPAA